jgi:hypothetical protein
MTDAELIISLEASKPRRSQFSTEEDFEESVGFWMGRQGRMLAQLRRRTNPRPSASARRTNWIGQNDDAES